MKTQKSFRKKALISSIAMLLVAMVALGTATYAWFSTKTSATASALSAKTTQGTNLMISEAKDKGWTQELTFANTSTTKLDPITTSDLEDWYTAKADGFDTQAAGTGGYTPSSEAGCLTQTVYVKYDAADGTIPLMVDYDITVNDGSQNYYRVAVVPVTGDGDLSAPTSFTQSVYANANNLADGATYGMEADNTTGTGISLGTIGSKTAEGAQMIYGYKFIIWFEGEDEDCIDSNAVNDISLDLTFYKGA